MSHFHKLLKRDLKSILQSSSSLRDIKLKFIAQTLILCPTIYINYWFTELHQTKQSTQKTIIQSSTYTILRSHKFETA